MKTRMKIVLAGLLAVSLAGPANAQNKDILQLQRDMIDVQQRVNQVQKTLDQNDAILKGLIEKTADQVNTLAGSMQRIGQIVDAIKSQNDASAREMRTILTNLNSTITELKDDLSSARSKLDSVSQQVTSMKTTAEPLAGPNDLWRSASLDYTVGNFDLAVSGFQEFLSKYPNDSRVAEAHLLMGDSWTAQKKYDQAIQEYDFVLQKFPDSDKTRAALLKKGLALAETNQPQQAVTTLNDVVKRFPNTSEAQSAQARLRDLQSPARRAPAR